MINELEEIYEDDDIFNIDNEYTDLEEDLELNDSLALEADNNEQNDQDEHAEEILIDQYKDIKLKHDEDSESADILDDIIKNSNLDDAQENIENNETNKETEEINVLENTSIDRRASLIQNSKEIIREFEKTEIQEIHRYVSTNIQYSVLQQIFTLTERPVEKAKVFTVVYRLISSAARYAGSDETRNKILKLLKECIEVKIDDKVVNIHSKLYEALSRHQNNTVNFNKHRLIRKLEYFFVDPTFNEKINKLIDAFLVFVERQELMDIDKVVGIDLENEEGIKTMGDMLNEKGEMDI